MTHSFGNMSRVVFCYKNFSNLLLTKGCYTINFHLPRHQMQITGNLPYAQLMFDVPHNEYSAIARQPINLKDRNSDRNLPQRKVGTKATITHHGSNAPIHVRNFLRARPVQIATVVMRYLTREVCIPSCWFSLNCARSLFSR